MLHEQASADKPVRILQVVGGMNHAGAETWLMRVLRHIDRDSFKMDFLYHSAEETAYDDEIEALGSRIIRCLRPEEPLRYSRNLRRILEEEGPYDVIHSHVYYLSGLPIYLAAKAGVPIRIAHMYPQEEKSRVPLVKRAYRWLLQRWITQYSTTILSCSQHSLDSYKQIFQARQICTGVAYCGLDLSEFDREIDPIAVRRKHGLPEEMPLIVYVARFMPHKNHAQVFRVAEKLRSSGFECHFLLIGSHGELMEQYVSQAAATSNVTVLTDIDDITDLLLASDVFFFPSLNEGFGIVATEAEAAGLPVVASDLPTIGEACPPSLHEYMFPPDDDDAASRSIQAVLTDRQLHRRLSADARAWAERFTIESSVRFLESHYTGQLAPAGDRDRRIDAPPRPMV